MSSISWPQRAHLVGVEAVDDDVHHARHLRLRGSKQLELHRLAACHAKAIRGPSRAERPGTPRNRRNTQQQATRTECQLGRKRCKCDSRRRQAAAAERQRMCPLAPKPPEAARLNGSGQKSQHWCTGLPQFAPGRGGSRHPHGTGGLWQPGWPPQAAGHQQTGSCGTHVRGAGGRHELRPCSGECGRHGCGEACGGLKQCTARCSACWSGAMQRRTHASALAGSSARAAPAGSGRERRRRRVQEDRRRSARHANSGRRLRTC